MPDPCLPIPPAAIEAAARAEMDRDQNGASGPTWNATEAWEREERLLDAEAGIRAALEAMGAREESRSEGRGAQFHPQRRIVTSWEPIPGEGE